MKNKEKKKHTAIIKKCFTFFYNKICQSIRLELILAFVLCIIVSLIVGAFTNNIFARSSKYARIDYRQGIEIINQYAYRFAQEISNSKYSENDSNDINRLINDMTHNNRLNKILICDLNGKVLFKSKNADETSVDIYSSIKNSFAIKDMGYSDEYSSSDIDENDVYTEPYPSNLKDKRVYVIVTGAPHGTIVYDDNHMTVESMFLMLCTFIFLFYLITKKKMAYIKNISDGLIEISKGKLDYNVQIKGKDELSALSRNINFMAEKLSEKIENERQIEKTKTDLITNVSHDLRTPLTSIKGYLGLIKMNRYKSREELQSFVDIAFKKSEKLEKLINDLFEFTKLESNSIKLDKKNICINELLDQLIFEREPLSENDGIEFKKVYDSENALAYIDGDKTVRVFENLFNNAIRYGKKPVEILVKVYETDDETCIDVSNKCEGITDEQVKKIFGRFYRVESSRSEKTGGSGLGLAIAKSIVNLQGGTIKAELNKDVITFTIKFKKAENKLLTN